jgi:putative ABC transport system permease protein
MLAHAARRQALLYRMGMSVSPEGSRRLPLAASGYAVSSDFFAMFDVPFLYGSAWSPQDDEGRASAVVVSESFNQKLFGGVNSTGREIVLNGRLHRIVGVTAHWDPKPRFFDLFSNGGFRDATDFYLPFNRALQLNVPTGGNSCRGHLGFANWDDWLRSNCVWATLWVELDSPAEVARYRQFLEGYAAKQQQAGRFAWSPNVRLRNVTQWLDYRKVVPPETRISLLVALSFFVICLVNTVGLLLAKFMRRAGEIGVRRALGASRRDIYTQYLTEAATVGVAGGTLGLLLTTAGISGVGLLFEPQIARLVHLDISLVGLTLVVAIFATVSAAFFPAWRAANVQPAWQLKSN